MPRKPFPHRTAILTLTTPHSPRSTVHKITMTGICKVSSRIAAVIRSFALSRGISPLAVDYEINWETA